VRAGSTLRWVRAREGRDGDVLEAGVELVGRRQLRLRHLPEVLHPVADLRLGAPRALHRKNSLRRRRTLPRVIL
jgi:hypothetical protein